VTDISSPAWPARVVTVDTGYAGFIRGRAGEFLHNGLMLQRVPDGVSALVAIGRDASAAAVLVPTRLPDLALPDFLDVIRAVGGIPVVVARDARVEEDEPEGLAELRTASVITAPITPSKLLGLLGGLDPLSAPEPRVFRFGGLELDVDRFRVTWHGHDVRMTPREFDLLHYVVAAHPRIVTTEELISELVPKSTGWQVSSIRTSVSRIRTSLESTAPGQPLPLETIPRVGYRLVEGSGATAGTRSSDTSLSTRENTSSLTRRTTSLGLPAGSASGQSM